MCHALQAIITAVSSTARRIGSAPQGPLSNLPTPSPAGPSSPIWDMALLNNTTHTQRLPRSNGREGRGVKGEGGRGPNLPGQPNLPMRNARGVPRSFFAERAVCCGVSSMKPSCWRHCCGSVLCASSRPSVTLRSPSDVLTLVRAARRRLTHVQRLHFVDTAGRRDVWFVDVTRGRV